LIDSPTNIPTDVTFEVKEKNPQGDHDNGNETSTFRAHKMVLAVASPVFQAEFFGLAKEVTDVIPVSDTTKEAFDTMLNHVYLKDVNLDVSFEKIFEVVNLAEKYEMQSLMNKIVEHLNSQEIDSEEFVLEIFELADMFPGFQEASKLLLSKCAKFMVTHVIRNVTDIAQFTSRCCEEGRGLLVLKVLTAIHEYLPNSLERSPHQDKQGRANNNNISKNRSRISQHTSTTTLQRTRSLGMCCKICFFLIVVIGVLITFFILTCLFGALVYSVLYMCCSA